MPAIDFLMWTLVGFLSGSVPWSLILSKYISGKDARDVGDGNPGATNAWISSGWIVGILAMTLDIGKATIPVWFLMSSLDPSSFADHLLTAIGVISPVLGHAWSPFLGFKGGKALASSWGSWIAITYGLAFPVALVILGMMHLIQKNHAITVTTCLAFFVIIFGFLDGLDYLIIFGLFNLALIGYKHRTEYSKGLIVRSWIRRLPGRDY